MSLSEFSVRYMTFNADRFLMELNRIELDELVILFECETLSFWKGYARPGYVRIYRVHDHREIREILKGFCPLCLGFMTGGETLYTEKP